MTWKRAFTYACLLLGAYALLGMVIAAMGWGIFWMLTRFPGALGIFLLATLALAILTVAIYFFYRLVGKRFTR